MAEVDTNHGFRMTVSDGERPVDALRRWQESGAVWRVMSRTSSRVVIAFLTCDGGEEVDRLTFETVDVHESVGDRVTNQANEENDGGEGTGSGASGL